MKKIKSWISLFRVKHYIKNILIFMPLFFSKQIEWSNIGKVIIGMLAFCLGSSIVYIINDINDVDKDRIHPTKCKRALASGEISIQSAIITIIILFILLCINIIYINSNMSFLTLVFYIVINIAYSKGLKNIPIIDVCILALGYLLRIFYGAQLLGIGVSDWLYLTIMSGAFFMGFGKRRGELNKIGKCDTRKVLQFYNSSFLDKNMYVSLGVTIVFYAMWCVDSNVSLGYNNLLWTVPIILVIFMRYSLLIEGTSDGDPVNVVLNDKILILLILFYITVITIILYF